MKKYYIYRIVNELNGKDYIGKRLCPKSFTPKTDTYFGSGLVVNRAFKKYGKENFRKEILVENIKTVEEINSLEISYIKKYKENGKAVYNISEGGDGGDTLLYASEEKKKEFCKNCSIVGKKYYKEHPEEVIKISKRTKKLWENQDYRLLQAKKRIGQKRTEETKKKMSISALGIIPDKETRKKMSISATKKFIKNPEFIENLREHGKKQWEDEAYRAKMLALHKELWKNEEYRKNQSETHKKPNTFIMKKVICVETGEFFNSIKEATEKTGISNISAVCRGVRKKAGGYTWEYVDILRRE